MAFVNFKTCCSDAKQFIRLVVLIICICVSVYQLAECFRKIRYPPTSSHYGFHLNDTLRYPAVTICRNPPYKTELFEKYGFPHNEIQTSTTWESFQYDNYTLEEFFNETTYTFAEIMRFAALDKEPTNINVSSSFSFTNGRCFTIKPINASNHWGTKYGYFFYFAHIDSELRAPKEVGGSLSGFHIFIQDEMETYTEKSQQADMFREYVYVEAGYSLEVNLKISKYHQLPSSNNDCNPNSNYNTSCCIEDHVNKQITEDVGCSTPWVPNENLPTCNNFEQVKKMIDYSTPSTYLDNYLQKTNCPMRCNATSYMPFVQGIREIESDCTLRIYLSSNFYTLMEEVIGYDWNNFLADLGGSLGFLLGLSVLGAITLAEQLVAVVIQKREAKKANLQLNNKNKKEDAPATDENTVEIKNVYQNESEVNRKNQVNEFKTDYEFYSKKNELNGNAAEKH